MKKLLAAILMLSMSLCTLTACSGGDNASSAQSGTGSAGNTNTAQGGTLYYLNFKPEIADVYKEIADTYKEETGVTLKVVTAASGTYEQTLKAEMDKNDAPTLFQVNGPRGYQSWKSYCADLKDTEIYKHLTDKSLAIQSGDGVYGIPYAIEGYGIIYNNAIMEKYFALKDKEADVDSADDIKDFKTLKTVVEDMTRHKDELGIKGVFASTSLKSGEDWRWQTHLMNVPVYYEFKENNVDLTSDAINTLNFTYSDNFKNLFDLYLQNSVTEPKMLGSKQVADSMAEFALGQCAMVQNGNWAWSQVKDVKGNTVKQEDIKYLPLYTGMKDDEKQGLCIGTENFMCINAKASEEQQKLAADFLNWLYTSDKGKEYVTEKLGFISPFDTFDEDEVPDDPLAKEVSKWMKNKEVTTIPWDFTIFPSQTFKNDFGAALLQYAQGTKSWDDVKKLAVDRWAAEAAALK